VIEYIAFMSVRREQEEMLRSFAPANDDVELTRSTGYWQAPLVGGLLASIGQSVRSLGKILIPKRETMDEGQLNIQEPTSLIG